MRGLPALLLRRDGYFDTVPQFPKSKQGGQWCDFRQRNGNRYFDPSMFAGRDDNFQRQFGRGCGSWAKRGEQQRRGCQGGEYFGHYFNPVFWRARFLRVTSASGHEKDQPYPVHVRIIDIFARDFGQFSELPPLLRGTGVGVDTTDRCDFIDDVRGFVERIVFSNNSVWETRSSTRWMRDVANVLASGLQLARQRH